MNYLKQQYFSQQTQVDANQEAAFYKTYKKLGKYQAATEMFHKPLNHFQGMLYVSQCNKKLPLKLGLVKDSAIQHRLALQHYRLGDTFMESLASGMEQIDKISHIKLANNRLSDQGLGKIL